MNTVVPEGRQAGAGVHLSRQASTQWWYAVDGRAVGPVSEQELRDMYVAAKLRASDMVWAEGMAEWIEVSTFLQTRRPPPPPPPRSAGPKAGVKPGHRPGDGRASAAEPPPRELSRREEFLNPAVRRFLRQTAMVAASGLGAAVLLTILNRMQVGGLIPTLFVVVPLGYLVRYVVREETSRRKQAVIASGVVLAVVVLFGLLFIAVALGI